MTQKTIGTRHDHGGSPPGPFAGLLDADALDGILVARRPGATPTRPRLALLPSLPMRARPTSPTVSHVDDTPPPAAMRPSRLDTDALDGILASRRPGPATAHGRPSHVATSPPNPEPEAPPRPPSSTGVVTKTLTSPVVPALRTRPATPRAPSEAQTPVVSAPPAAPSPAPPPIVSAAEASAPVAPGPPLAATEEAAPPPAPALAAPPRPVDDGPPPHTAEVLPECAPPPVPAAAHAPAIACPAIAAPAAGPAPALHGPRRSPRVSLGVAGVAAIALAGLAWWLSSRPAQTLAAPPALPAGSTTQAIEPAVAAPSPLPTANAAPPQPGSSQPSPAAPPATSDAPALEAVYFAYASAVPQIVSSDALRAMAGRLAACPGRIVLTGHTCDLGPEATNRSLGLVRAANVRSLLITAGIAERRFVLRSVGMADPAAPNATDLGRANNRRVTAVCE